MLALLLAGILGGAAFGIVIWINHTRLEVPENSEVAINADGSVRVTTPRMKAAAAVNAEPEAGSSGEPRLKAKNHGVQAAHSELKVIKPWFPGAEPSDTPPQPPPGTATAFRA